MKMASTVQERPQLSRGPLDKWTTKEHLCLASAVSCSGDQNWMSVSRTLKLVCGNGTPTRPADWYSQKNCALQFGHLLENVETPKRKRRTSEGASGISSPAIMETPTDLILRRLNDERIQELKAEIRREQEEFAQIYRELKVLQSGTLSEEQMREMWSSIEKQQEQERVEEMKMENLIREREQQKMEMQRNWRVFAPTTTPNISVSPAIAADTTSVDMDVEEITQMSSTQQQQPATQPATSPLLSSLLKTPSPGNNTPTTLSKNTLSNSTNISARSSAPTITTLLTSGYVPNKNQPAITLKAGIPPQKAAQLLSSPISGPPTMTSIPVTTITPQNLLSPSQAAPTLSMLLEKNKGSTANEENRNGTLTPKAVEPTVQTQLDDVHKIVADSNNEEIPMELEDDISTTVHDSNVNILNANDSDDPDPNEEQQLLEVFKNIGNIDELDIDVSAVIDDEEVDFLKDMTADSPSENTHVRDFDKDGTDDLKIINEINDNIEDLGEKDSEQNPEIHDKTSTDDLRECEIKDSQTVANFLENKPGKAETISSDDSNDNIPLAAVASLEQKSAQDKAIFKESTDLAVECEALDDNCETVRNQKSITKSRLDSFEEDNKDHDKLEKQLADLVGANETDESKNLEEDGKSPVVSENSDVIVIPTDDDDSSGDRARQANEKSNVEDAAKIKKDLESDIGSLEVSKETSELGEELAEVGDTNNDAIVSLQPIISIADTDDDSSTTDNSIATRKDDKPGNSIKYNAPQVRKSLHEPTRQDPQSKTDDESTTQFSSSSSSSVTPARPPLLRKLRDRDRSESPLIESEACIAGNTANNAGSENSGSQRLRRRYSSTPVNDSVPNSPASSDRDRDDSETRMSKKSLLSIFHALQYSKNVSTMQRSFHEDCKFNEICLRPTDMHAIRKQIESGSIRNVTELQRDIMLMCQNGLMLFKHNTTGYNAANAFSQECQAIREFVANTTNGSSAEHSTHGKDNKDGNKSLNASGISTKSRSSSRKSQRIS